MRKSRTVLSSIGLLFAIAILLCATVQHVFAQRKSIKQYVHQIWTANEGLPQNSAANIKQTRDGYIWFATQEGLARFDGQEFTVFDRTNTKALPAAWMVRVFEDGEGGLWMRPVGYAPGMVRHFGGKFTHYDTTNGLPHNRVIAGTTDSLGTTWLGTLNGLAEYKNGKFKTYTVRDGLPADTIPSLGTDKKGNLWIGTVRGIARLTGGKIEALTGTKEFPDTLLQRMNIGSNCYEDRSGRVWMNSPTHLIAYRDGIAARFDKKAVLSDPNILAFHEDAKGTIWIGTAAGLNSYSDGKFMKFNISGGQSENRINIILEDKNGDLWLATGKGIARFADGKFEVYQHADGLSDDGVQDMLIDTEGSIWVSTFGGGVDRFRDEKFVTYSSKVGLSYDNVEAVFQDHTGAIWVGGAFGALNKLMNGAITHFNPKRGPAFEDLRTLAEDGEGNLWIGTSSGDYTLRNGVITPLSRTVNGQPEPASGAFLLTKSGQWLVGSLNQFFLYKSGKYTPLAVVGSRTVNADWITGLFEDSRGTVWVSTQAALYWYKDGQLEKVGAEKGFRRHGRWRFMRIQMEPSGLARVARGSSDTRTASLRASHRSMGCSTTMYTASWMMGWDTFGCPATEEYTASARNSWKMWLTGRPALSRVPLRRSRRHGKPGM